MNPSSIIGKPYFCLQIFANESKQDLLIPWLFEIGAEGIEQEPHYLMAYFATEPPLHELQSIQVFQDCSFSITTLEPTNWNQAWEKHFEKVIVEGICEIYAPHHQPSGTLPYQICIEPQMSFGTGHHATTQLMIQLMNDLPMQGKAVLDMGAGTGILGIFALFKKAAQVLFIEIEPIACENIAHNLQLNHLPHAPIICGDAESIPPCSSFDFILANIQKNVLIHDANDYWNALQTKGFILLSGFFDFDCQEIQTTYEQLGGKTMKILENNGWNALLIQKI